MSDGSSHTREKLLLENEQLRRRISHLELMERDHRAAEAGLREYEAIVNHSQDFTTLIDRDYRYAAVSESFCRGLGRERQGILGRMVGEIWGRNVFEHIMQPRLARCFGGDVVSYEARFAFPGKSSRHFSVTCSPIYDDQGQVTHTVVVSRDITDRVVAEEALRQYEAIVNHSQDLMTLVSRDFRYVAVSQSFCDAHLKPRQDILGHGVADLWGEEVFEESIRPYFHRCLEGECVEYEARFPIPRHGERYFSVTVSPYRDAQGAITHAVVVSRDIEQRKHAEEKLAESERRFRSIAENLDVVVWLQALDRSRFDYVNAASERVLGRRPGEILKDPEAFRERVHPEDRWRIDQLYAGHQAGLEYGSAEYRVCLPDGRVRWLRDRSVRVEGSGEGEPAVAGITLDVTEIKAAEERMRQVSRLDATATLAGGVAHDFNNLMVGVLGNAELLKADCPAESEQAQMLEEVIEAARRAGELAQKLLAFARGGKYRPRRLSLQEVVHETVGLHRGLIPEAVRLTLESDKDLWPVHADPEQMKQVLVNLCLNAVEAMESGGNLYIATRNVRTAIDGGGGVRRGRFVVLSVEDDGSGIPEEIRPRVFEPFVSSRDRGRGLGLAAVYGIVENHGGVIALEDREGGGTAIRLFFPASESGVGDVSTDEQKPPRGTETLLLIDDEPMVLAVSSRILARLGYSVMTASSGEAAIQMVRTYQGRIHLAILDLGMPGLSGEETFPFLREAHPEMRIIICSGYERDSVAESLLQSGAAAFIQKPFSMEELAKVLQAVLKA